MSIQIPITITKQELDKIKRLLKKKSDLICLDDSTYIKTNLVAMKYPWLVKAKIVKGY